MSKRVPGSMRTRQSLCDLTAYRPERVGLKPRAITVIAETRSSRERSGQLARLRGISGGSA